MGGWFSGCQSGATKRSRACAELQAAVLPGRRCGVVSAGARGKSGSHRYAHVGCFAVPSADAAVALSEILSVMTATAAIAKADATRRFRKAFLPTRAPFCYDCG